MKYQAKSFTVAASAGSKAQCDAEGHPWADSKGKCIRCGHRIRATGFGEPLPVHPEAKRRPKEPA